MALLAAVVVVVLNARTEERASRCNKDIVYVCVSEKERGRGQYVKAQQRTSHTSGPVSTQLLTSAAAAA